jgi:poly(A) polymerase
LAQAENRNNSAPEWDGARKFLGDTPEPRLPFSGNDLMARGFRSGPAIGDALKVLQRLWIEAGFPEDAESLSKLLEGFTRERE